MNANQGFVEFCVVVDDGFVGSCALENKCFVCMYM